jgi:hypothetical protein
MDGWRKWREYEGRKMKDGRKGIKGGTKEGEARKGKGGSREGT